MNQLKQIFMDFFINILLFLIYLFLLKRSLYKFVEKLIFNNYFLTFLIKIIIFLHY